MIDAYRFVVTNGAGFYLTLPALTACLAQELASQSFQREQRSSTVEVSNNKTAVIIAATNQQSSSSSTAVA